MAKKTKETQALDQVTDTQADAASDPGAPRLPQGIVLRYMESGDPKKDFHHIHRSVPSIDPASLVVDGEDPFLALPIDRRAGTVRIRQVGAKEAARMLTCDPASGGQSLYRLATDAEVAQYRREHAPKVNK